MRKLWSKVEIKVIKEDITKIRYVSIILISQFNGLIEYLRFYEDSIQESATLFLAREQWYTARKKER
jgi:hypothetical protein